MIIDKNLVLSDAQTMVSVTTVASTDYIDQGATGSALDGSEMYLVVSTGTLDFDSGSDNMTLIIALQTHEDSAFSAGTKTLFISKTFTQAQLVANTRILAIKLPAGLERYIRLYYTAANTPTVGSVNAYITAGVDFTIDEADVLG